MRHKYFSTYTDSFHQKCMLRSSKSHKHNLELSTLQILKKQAISPSKKIDKNNKLLKNSTQLFQDFRSLPSQQILSPFQKKKLIQTNYFKKSFEQQKTIQRYKKDQGQHLHFNLQTLAKKNILHQNESLYQVIKATLNILKSIVDNDIKESKDILFNKLTNSEIKHYLYQIFLLVNGKKYAPNAEQNTQIQERLSKNQYLQNKIKRYQRQLSLLSNKVLKLESNLNRSKNTSKQTANLHRSLDIEDNQKKIITLKPLREQKLEQRQDYSRWIYQRVQIVSQIKQMINQNSNLLHSQKIKREDHKKNRNQQLEQKSISDSQIMVKNSVIQEKQNLINAKLEQIKQLKNECKKWQCKCLQMEKQMKSLQFQIANYHQIKQNLDEIMYQSNKLKQQNQNHMHQLKINIIKINNLDNQIIILKSLLKISNYKKEQIQAQIESINTLTQEIKMKIYQKQVQDQQIKLLKETILSQIQFINTNYANNYYYQQKLQVFHTKISACQQATKFLKNQLFKKGELKSKKFQNINLKVKEVQDLLLSLNSQYLSKQKHINQKLLQIQKVQRQIQGKEKIIKQLSTKIECQFNEINKLQEQINHLKQCQMKISKSIREQQEFKIKNDKLFRESEDKILAFEALQSENEKKIKAQLLQIQSLSKRIEQQKIILNDLTAKIGIGEQNLLNLEQQINNKQKLVQNTNKKIQQKINQLNQRDKLLDDRKREFIQDLSRLDANKAQSQNIFNKISSNEKVLIQLQNKISSSENTLIQIQNKIQIVKQNISKLSIEQFVLNQKYLVVNDLNTKIQKLKINIIKAQQTQAATERICNSLIENKQILNHSILELTEKKHQVECSIVDLNLNFESFKSQYQIQSVKLINRISEIYRQIQVEATLLEKIKSNRSEAKQKMNEQIQTYENIIKSKKQEVEKINQTLLQLKDQFQQRLAAFSYQYNGTQSENRIIYLSQDVIQINNQQQPKQKLYLTESIMTQKDEIEELKQTKYKIQEQIHNLEQKFQFNLEKNQDLQSKMKELEDQIKLQSEKFEIKLNEMHDFAMTLERQIEEKNNKIYELDNIIDQKQILLSEIQMEQKEVIFRNQQHQQLILSNERKLIELKQQISLKQRENSNLLKAINNDRSYESQLKLNIQNYEKKIRQIKRYGNKQLQKYNNLMKQNQNCQIEVEKGLSDIEALKRQYENLKKINQSKKIDLQRISIEFNIQEFQLSKLDSEIKDLQNKRKELAIQISNLQQEDIKLSQLIEKSYIQLVEIESQIYNQRVKFAQDKTKLKSNLKFEKINEKKSQIKVLELKEKIIRLEHQRKNKAFKYSKSASDFRLNQSCMNCSCKISDQSKEIKFSKIYQNKMVQTDLKQQQIFKK